MPEENTIAQWEKLQHDYIHNVNLDLVSTVCRLYHNADLFKYTGCIDAWVVYELRAKFYNALLQTANQQKRESHDTN